MKKFTWPNQIFCGIKLPAIFLLLISTVISMMASAQYDGGVEDLPSVQVIGMANGGTVAFAQNATVSNSFAPGFEQSKKIKNIVRLSLFEETNLYLSADFTVTVPVKIEYGPNSSTVYEHNQNFTVSYSKAEGTKYNAKNYFSFDNAEFVRITITGPLSIPSAGGVNMSDILLLENEMRVTRYFDLQPTTVPLTFSGPPSVTNPVDRATVTWSWPANTGHNATQIEWTWLENELEQYYHTNGLLNVDLLFAENATRVDLPYGKDTFYIPLFYDGVGKLYYRIRPVNIKASGSRQDGQWTVPISGAGICAYNGHNNALNWQVRTSFAEEGKMKSVMEYYDGSLRSRQTVTKENIHNTTIYAETFYDYEGRPVIQILPSPGLNTVIKYQANLNLFNSQANNQNPAEFFDLSPINGTGNTLYNTPALATTTGTSRYYSPQNDELAALNPSPEVKNIPDAEGYPYTVTRYTPDATGRIMAQSGVGPAHKMGSTRETKYYYGTPAQEELDGLFGTEVGNYTHYFKNMVKDANGQMSVSYIDMHGRTVATALAGDAPSNLLALNINDPAHYPNQAGSTITRNLLNAATNIVKNNSIESLNTLLVPATTNYNFSYNLAPDKLELLNCTAGQLCYDCLYDLEISITDESGDSNPVSWKFSNVSLNPDDNCTTGTPALSLVSGNGVAIAGNTISFTHQLLPGSYSVRKTLTISESSLQKYKALFFTPGKGICKTEQEIIDSVYNVLLSTANCNAPASPSCQSCLNDLGEYTTFRTAFLASVGNPFPVPPSLETEMQNAFNAALQNCNNICNTTSQLTSSKRQLMLADMMPYGGQYATEAPITTNNGTTMYNKYNIFQTSYNPSLQPYYKKPEPQNGSGGRYRDALGNTDPQIHPDGTTTFLNTLNAGEFTNQFVNQWADALLPYHPEYPRLQFAENTLAPANVYNWITTFNNTNLYTAAQSASYLFASTTGTDINDPFYNIAPSSYRIEMGGWVANNYANSNLSLWQIARGQVMCLNQQGNTQNCYINNGFKVPPQVFNGLSTTQRDEVWQAFRNLYSSARDEQVNKYITQQHPLTDDAALIAQGYQLRYGTNQQTAQQYNWQWYPPVIGAGNNPPVLPPTNAGSTYQSRCESYISQWKTQLLDCQALATHLQKDQILTEITNGMKDVCLRGSDAANPYGSSTVSPANVSGTLPNSFEQVITNVFAAYSINTTNSYFCNPYVIEFPKPYGKGPRFAQEYTTTVDSCACAHFDSLKVKLAQAAVNYTQLPAVNNYLLANNMDTLSSVLHFALLNCSIYQVLVCDSTLQQKTVSCYDPLPCDYMCAPRQSGQQRRATSSLTEANPLNCTQFQEIVGCYFDMFDGGPLPYTYPNCQNNFTSYFNGWWPNTNYSWAQIDSISLALCGTSLNVCSSCEETIMCAVDTNCRWVFAPYTLSSPQPLPDFLKCGGWPPASKCMTCDSMVSLTTEFKTKFIAPYDNGPLFTSSNLTPEQIEQNILYARFLNFRTGFQYTWMQYAQASAATNCDPLSSGGGGTTDLVVTVRNGNTPQQYIASNSITFDPDFDHPVGDDYETLLQPNGGGGSTQTVICRNNQYLNDTTGLFVVDTPCHRIRTLAISLGQSIYQQQILAIQANFEQQYRAKCMAALNYETFTVNYTSKEYHYTLYYYDMAGSLVKTVPPKGVRPDFSTAFTNSVKAARAVDGHIPRPHEYITQYRYNSLRQIFTQNSPDGNTSKFWYDKLGRLVVSQNAQQAVDGKYSYTSYDQFGRITEVGQKPHSTPMSQQISQDQHPTISLNSWITTLGNGGGYREQITLTGYDVPFGATPANPNGIFYGLGLDQRNMRNRVSYTLVRNFETDINNPPYFHTGTFYTYDIHGNVDTLLQDYSGVGAMSSTSNGQKRLVYNYDLISGKVNQVSYQPDWYNSVTQQWERPTDKFFHRYRYDAENRLTKAYTSRDAIEWEKDAAYSYNKHGSLNRAVLGQQQVQGIDYAYTLQGWLKGVNGTNSPTGDNGEYDMGGDALASGANSKVAKDAYGFGLHYFDDGTNRDYQAIGANLQYFADPNNPAFVALYNGNIGAMSVNIGAFSNKANATNNELPLFYNYRYDQLNRIRSMDAYWGLGYVGRNANRWIPQLMDDYKEAITYDPNGNILTYLRQGSPSVPGKQPQMDDLNYSYIAGKNQLRQIMDNPAYSNNYTEDIDNQTNPNNYAFDQIGNLVYNDAEDIDFIKWTVYGKIDSIQKGNGNHVKYTYDAAGNRITKKTYTASSTISKMTVYVRDARGNVMSIYERATATSAVEQIESHVYGSSRIGIVIKQSVATVNGIILPGWANTGTLSTFTRGEKLFELSNHLGNVLVTVSDRKIQMQSSINLQLVGYYNADAISAVDYYPFGMEMPGRNFQSDNYRFGFNGKENDNSINVGAIAFEARIYDSRIGRFFSRDPLERTYPFQSTYVFAHNRPVALIDYMGMGDPPPDPPQDFDYGIWDIETVNQTNFVGPGVDNATLIQTRIIITRGFFDYNSDSGGLPDIDYTQNYEVVIYNIWTEVSKDGKSVVSTLRYDKYVNGLQDPDNGEVIVPPSVLTYYTGEPAAEIMPSHPLEVVKNDDGSVTYKAPHYIVSQNRVDQTNSVTLSSGNAFVKLVNAAIAHNATTKTTFDYMIAQNEAEKDNDVLGMAKDHIPFAGTWEAVLHQFGVKTTFDPNVKMRAMSDTFWYQDFYRIYNGANDSGGYNLPQGEDAPYRRYKGKKWSDHDTLINY
jgi:RHS repeat-associated protein